MISVDADDVAHTALSHVADQVFGYVVHECVCSTLSYLGLRADRFIVNAQRRQRLLPSTFRSQRHLARTRLRPGSRAARRELSSPRARHPTSMRRPFRLRPCVPHPSISSSIMLIRDLVRSPRLRRLRQALPVRRPRRFQRHHPLPTLRRTFADDGDAAGTPASGVEAREGVSGFGSVRLGESEAWVALPCVLLSRCRVRTVLMWFSRSRGGSDQERDAQRQDTPQKRPLVADRPLLPPSLPSSPRLRRRRRNLLAPPASLRHSRNSTPRCPGPLSVRPQTRPLSPAKGEPRRMGRDLRT